MIYVIALLVAGVLSQQRSCPTLPTPVVYCGDYKGGECTGKGAGCVGEGWFSKDNVRNPNQRINAQQICKSYGYSSHDTMRYGGNWGHQCRHPGNTRSLHNKAGGSLYSFGYTVTWKCVGNKNCGGAPSPTPNANCKATRALPSVVQDCGKYSRQSYPECRGRGAGCVGQGWFSKDNVSNPYQRVNAQQICITQGYKEGADPNSFGGNWGHKCRHPGNSRTSHNKAGGALTNLGYTVSWKCKGSCSGGTPTPPPTFKPGSKCPNMPYRVVDCGVYLKKYGNGAECKRMGKICRGEGWFSKDNTVNPNQRVDAHKICREQGYVRASTVHYGGNWGHQCRHPGTTANSLNKAGGSLTNFGYTVTWKCEGTRKCQDHAPQPTPKPTPMRREPCGPLPEKKVVECGKYSQLSYPECKGKGAGCVGKGWFSKDNTVQPDQRVNAVEICKQMGYTGVDMRWYGGNWGHQCRHPGTSKNTANKAGGAVTNLGYTVTWKCMGESRCDRVTPKPTPGGVIYPKDNAALAKICGAMDGKPGDKQQGKKCKKALGKVGKCVYGKKNGKCTVKNSKSSMLFGACPELKSKKRCKKPGKSFKCKWDNKKEICNAN